MFNSQSYPIDWNTINEFKRQINTSDYYDPFMVGRVQKLLIEICNRTDCIDILVSKIQASGILNYNGIDRNNLMLFGLQTPNADINNVIIDIILQFLKDILNSNRRFPGITQDSIATLNQISLMNDQILFEYIKRAITIFKYFNTNNEYVYHILLNYSYYQ